MAHLSDCRPPNRRQAYEHGGEPEEIRRSTVILSLAGTSSGKPARSYAAIPLERIALLTLGAAASDAMLWRALVSTTKRTLKPARAELSQSIIEEFDPALGGKLPRLFAPISTRGSYSHS